MKNTFEKTLTVKYDTKKKMDVNAKVILWEKLKQLIGKELTGFCADKNDFAVITVTKDGEEIIVQGTWELK